MTSLKLFTFIISFSASISAACFPHLPEEDMNVPEIIEYYGYPIETHEVTTKDGYILHMHRIPFGIKENSSTNPISNQPRPVFFLQHGLLASSADWVTNLPNQSAGFVLADSGFDVWMGNVRGNFYSSTHVNYSTSDHRYWQFTWDEMSEHDLTCMIDAVLDITKQSSLYYMGHSQGTEIMFAKLASEPKFAQKIHKFFALAPVSTVGHIKGLLAWLGKYLGNLMWLVKKLFGTRDFLPHNWLSGIFATIVCGPKWTNPLCFNVLFQIGGPESKQFNQTRLMVYMHHTPAGTSTWNILHWAQMYRSKTLQKFDFGSKEDNMKHYGTIAPPLYNLSLVNVPTYLYYSESDWLADAQDVRESLLSVVPKEFIKLSKNLPHFNHFDFLWGLKAHDEIYTEIINITQQHHTNRMRILNSQNKGKN
ncbi:alpha/beta-hydrolase lipase region domain-containing protein [Ditylenchus destructor]|nr:alpha/beta-hydrolase lipase region domain-containing protein [Ditylenchus destructor]